MASAAAAKVYTPEDVLALERDRLYELVDGQLVERDMRGESSWLSARFVRHLGNYPADGDRGFVLDSSAGLQIFPWAPGQLRRGDAVVYAVGRLPGDVQALAT